jgi:hypothetical protein
VYTAPPIPAVPSGPEPSPAPTVIEYPTGRYELRGDGASTPYSWVWIPNPPPAPPAEPPGAPPGPGAAPAPTDLTPAPRVIYRWTDAEGVVHFTDSLDAVPLEYRARAKRPPS